MIEINGLVKNYTKGNEVVPVLNGLDIAVKEGDFVALMGPSGSGKSTLLYLMAGLDQPTAGHVSVANKNLVGLSDAALARFRSENLGFIFQAYNLMPVLTARENVELPLLLTSVPKHEYKQRALTALRVVGLEDRADHYPRQLSGGQEQRVAIARAIVNDPKLIIADEPTGDLDRKSADDILALLGKLNQELGKTIVMVTHDPEAASHAKTLLHLNKGTLQKETAQPLHSSMVMT